MCDISQETQDMTNNPAPVVNWELVEVRTEGQRPEGIGMVGMVGIGGFVEENFSENVAKLSLESSAACQALTTGVSVAQQPKARNVPKSRRHRRSVYWREWGEAETEVGQVKMKERIWSRGERSELHQNVLKTGSKWMKSEQLRRASELKRSEGRGPEREFDEPKGQRTGTEGTWSSEMSGVRPEHMGVYRRPRRGPERGVWDVGETGVQDHMEENSL
ncbi:hypothetical protein C8F04DRAFT_1192380 [Mycena alexandri]|uniref:Uncharacterized protein n=1 Tax=Mycena alexandri TaxID=1745969 RepID=A0AAD6SFF2_9AGAR|nr:hypothetical protein C8F04DRAFT_1192380 [Mycena alexandri]